MRIPALFLCMTALAWGAAPELGEINGAKFRIDKPERWNGVLILYCHGYNRTPVSFDSGPIATLEPFLDQGYAVAQSGYAAGGWAVPEAMQDIETLRLYFTSKYGAAKRTYLVGHSLGGFLTMALLEKSSGAYTGGLALCGPLAAPTYFMKRHAFDLSVQYEFYFKAAPAESAREVEAALESKPAEADTMRLLAGVQNNRDLAETLSYNAYILKEVSQRAGGNPFDNRKTIYKGSSDDKALNRGVKRSAADPRAAAWLARYYTPTGRLKAPLLAIHTTYDPIVPDWIPKEYSKITAAAGSGRLLVQQSVKRNGHCAIAPGELASGFIQLRQWAEAGTRPASGLSP